MRLVHLAAVICLLPSAPISAELERDIAAKRDDSTSARQPDSGVEVRAAEGQSGALIHWMAFNGDKNGVAQAIISGADVNDRVKNGSTPLHIAAYKGHTAVARLLIEHGAKVNLRTEDGSTPLDWAQRNGHEEVAVLLLKHGAKTNMDSRDRASSKYLANPPERNKVSPKRAAPVKPREPINYFRLPTPRKSIVALSRSFDADERTETPVSEESFRVQLGAFSSKQRAMDAWASYKNRYSELLGSRKFILEPVTVNAKEYHRVQTEPMNRSDALAICTRLKEASQACFVLQARP